MTHGDIKTKFLIEYDKMTTTSSYPSLTDYEIETVLDKAYLAIIANKFTGNNPRKVGFEGDNKAIEDIRPLIKTKEFKKVGNGEYNQVDYTIPSDMMFLIQGNLSVYPNTRLNVQLVSHDIARSFKQTANNLPWIPNPTIYIDGDQIHLLYDSYKYKSDQIGKFECVYIEKPKMFVNSDNDTQFELSESVAQEVINMSIIMSAEIVESQRLSTKASINSFES